MGMRPTFPETLPGGSRGVRVQAKWEGHACTDKGTSCNFVEEGKLREASGLPATGGRGESPWSRSYTRGDGEAPLHLADVRQVNSKGLEVPKDRTRW